MTVLIVFQALVVLMYIVYAVVAIYGCAGMRKGVSFKKLSNADSYLAHYYAQKDNLFNQYGPSVALVFDEPTNYSDPTVSQNFLHPSLCLPLKSNMATNGVCSGSGQPYSEGTVRF